MMATVETDATIATLVRFAGLADEGRFSGVKDLQQLRARSDTLVRRLSTPVRAMIAGEFSSGKSTLTNLLVGEQLIPTSVLASELPPVVFRYTPAPRASACWWAGREPVTFAVPDFDRIKAVRPDYIVMGVPNPLLKQVSIIDTPGTSDPEREGEILVDLAGRADTLVWCTNAVQAWRESERHIWSSLPPAVTAFGLMAVTHADVPAVRAGFDRIMARLKREAGPRFKAILPLDAPGAIAASPRGTVADVAAWERTGGAGLQKALLDLAAERRDPDLTLARELVSQRIGPLLADLDRPPVRSMPAVSEPAQPAASPKGSLAAKLAMRKVSASPAPSAAVVRSAAGATAAPLRVVARSAVPQPGAGARLVAAWHERIDGLAARAAAAPDIEEAGFVRSAGEVVTEILDVLAEGGLVSFRTAWIEAQFREALDTLLLMQAETGPGPVEDAAALLVQIGRDLGTLLRDAGA